MSKEFGELIKRLDELLTHFNKTENVASETDFIQLRYIKNQLAHLEKLMTM